MRLGVLEAMSRPGEDGRLRDSELVFFCMFVLCGGLDDVHSRGEGERPFLSV